MGYLDEAEEFGVDITVEYVLSVVYTVVPWLRLPILNYVSEYIVEWVIKKGFEFAIRKANFAWIKIENEGDVEEVNRTWKKWKESKDAPDKKTKKKRKKEYREAASDLIKLRLRHL